jgi:hypothetical protein
MTTLNLVKPILKETASMRITTADLKDQHIVDSIASRLQHQGFPEKFELNLKTENSGPLVVEFDLKRKEVNEDKGYHYLMFSYELDHASLIKIHTILNKAKDMDEEEYDDLKSELKFDEFVVTIEFGNEFRKAQGKLD